MFLKFLKKKKEKEKKSLCRHDAYDSDIFFFGRWNRRIYLILYNITTHIRVLSNALSRSSRGNACV